MMNSGIQIDRTPRPDFSDLVPRGEPTYAIAWRGDAGLSGCGCGCGECQGASGGCGCSSEGAFGHLNVVASGVDYKAPGGDCGGGCAGEAQSDPFSHYDIVASGWDESMAGGGCGSRGGGCGGSQRGAAGGGGSSSGFGQEQWDYASPQSQAWSPPGQGQDPNDGSGGGDPWVETPGGPQQDPNDGSGGGDPWVEAPGGPRQDPNDDRTGVGSGMDYAQLPPPGEWLSPGCRVPTIQRFALWPSKDNCFLGVSPAYYNSTRKIECCDQIGGFDMGPTRPCLLPNESELANAKQFFVVDWLFDPPLLSLPQVVQWDEIFATAWALLLSNLDVLAWTLCYYSALSDLWLPWPETYRCLAARIQSTSGPARPTFRARHQGPRTENFIMVTGKGRFGTVGFYPHPGGSAEGFALAWQASMDAPRRLCIAIDLASVILHELMHSCGEDHPKKGDCEYQWAVQRSWLAAVSERYGACLDGTCCATLTDGGSPSRWGGETQWGVATKPNKEPFHPNCLPGGSGAP